MSSASIESEFQLPAQAPFARWVEVLLILLVFFAVAGDPPPSVNEPHYLCRLKHFWNPAWCMGDLFLDSSDTQLAFIWLFGWVTKFLSLTATAWIGRAIAWTMLAWAWQRLSWRLVPRPLAAVLSGALFVTLIDRAHLAGEWVVGGVEAKCFAYGFVLLALRELVDARWNRLWLSLGAASALHPVVGGWSAIVCAGIWLLDGRHATTLRAMAPGLIGGLLLALLGVVPALSLTWNESPEVVAKANVIYVYQRLPHHLALLHLPESEVVQRLLRHGTLLGALWVLTRCVRVSRTAQIDTGGLRRIALFAWGGVLLALTGFAIELTFWNYPDIAARLLKYYWFRLTDVAAALAAALYGVSLIVAGMERRRWWSMCLLTIAIGFTGWHLLSLSIARYSEPVPPADRKLRDFADWLEVCDWINANTPIDANFLTPRSSSSFKWRTGRAEVVTYKDIPQDALSMVEWFRRLRDIYYIDLNGMMKPLKSLGHLPTQRVEQIIDEYNIDYIITEGDAHLAFPVVYRTGDSATNVYVVYKVDHRNSGDRR